ncbi:MAG TPA: hypothetical protein VMS64_06935 [Candidatus Methylomirabilis sp.]|nr:hypothetical protein [Candidatus Methylomirabilis sp.]
MMPDAPGAGTGTRAEAALEFSPVRGDALYRLQRKIGLIPAHGLGVGRRALFWSLVAWLPIAVWAIAAGRALPGTAAEPLLQHFGVHVRFLFAIPVLILGEAMAHAVGLRIIPYFARSGLVPEADRARFVSIIRDTARLRDTWRPWLVLAVLVLAWTFANPPERDVHELLWAGDNPQDRLHLGFGGWWFLYVARPIFLALALVWLWRLFLVTVLLARIARLPLGLVPTHPDRAAGLGFLAQVPTAFAPLSLALSAVLASRWAHEVVYHGASTKSYQVSAAIFAVTMAVLLLIPVLVFTPRLAATRRLALLDYGALVGEHGRLVRRRWILGEKLEAPVLDAPELGPVADTVSLYEAVSRTRAAPIGRQTLLIVGLPIAVPLLLFFMIEVPVREHFLKLLLTLL